jgi:hypothetical protein
MKKFYVSIQGITDEQLLFLGYRLVKEDPKFKLFEDYKGDEYIVEKSNPWMYVDDMNDAIYLNGNHVIVAQS